MTAIAHQHVPLSFETHQAIGNAIMASMAQPAQQPIPWEEQVCKLRRLLTYAPLNFAIGQGVGLPCTCVTVLPVFLGDSQAASLDKGSLNDA